MAKPRGMGVVRLAGGFTGAPDGVNRGLPPHDRMMVDIAGTAEARAVACAVVACRSGGWT
jgi:hypothetical protein